MGEAVGVDVVWKVAVGDEAWACGGVEVDTVGDHAVGDDEARVGKVGKVDAVENLAVGDDGASVGEAVEVGVVENVAVGDDGGCRDRCSRKRCSR